MKIVINYSLSCRSKPIRPLFIFRTQIRIFLMKSGSFLTLYGKQCIWNLNHNQLRAHIHFEGNSHSFPPHSIILHSWMSITNFGLHDILHAIVVRISSVKTVLSLAVNLHHLLSDGAAFNTQSCRSLTSYAISRSKSNAIHLRLWARIASFPILFHCRSSYIFPSIDFHLYTCKCDHANFTGYQSSSLVNFALWTRIMKTCDQGFDSSLCYSVKQMQTLN